MEPSTVQLRNTLRQTFRERRKRLSASEQDHAAKQLVQHCIELDMFEQAKRVALYKTNDGELSTHKVIEHLWAMDIEVYLPVLHPFSDGHLLFLQYTTDSAMLANGFGILEPRLDCTLVAPLHTLDIIFTPLVAFDDQGNRLGMGGGFYDRTLAQLSHKETHAKPQIIGLAHDIQQTLSLPTEAWDIPLPTIITPSQTFTF